MYLGSTHEDKSDLLGAQYRGQEGPRDIEEAKAAHECVVKMGTCCNPVKSQVLGRRKELVKDTLEGRVPELQLGEPRNRAAGCKGHTRSAAEELRPRTRGDTPGVPFLSSAGTSTLPSLGSANTFSCSSGKQHPRREPVSPCINLENGRPNKRILLLLFSPGRPQARKVVSGLGVCPHNPERCARSL